MLKNVIQFISSQIGMLHMCNKHVHIMTFMTQMSPTLDTSKRGKQKSRYQKDILMKTFEAKPYLENKEKFALAGVLNITKRRIENWFSKRRFGKRKDESKHKGE